MQRGFFLTLCAGALASASAAAQQPGNPVTRPTFSIGQPPRLKFDAGLVQPLHGDRESDAPWLSLSMYRSLTNPLTGLLGVTGEAYGSVDVKSGGARVFAESRLFGLSLGADWSASAGRVSPILSYRTAIQRGGLFGRGGMVRVDWLPTRDQTFGLGLVLPIFRPLAGKTRPHVTHLDLASLGERSGAVRGDDGVAIREAARVIAAYANTYSASSAGLVAHTQGGYTAVWGRYDRMVHDVFRRVDGDSATAARMVERARGFLLDRVVLPVDSLFGQAKSNPEDLRPLTRTASTAFGKWLSDSSRLSAERQSAASTAFGTWLNAIADVYAELARDAGDSRLTWLPLDLALRPDQFDEQAEVDSILARTIGHPFSDRNALTYLRSADLPLEIARSIYATRNYHVLWTHDFTGRRESGTIDNVAYSMVADAYLPALTAAVKRYDSTGAFPVYMILQDEFFYEPRDNRLWMTILEDPLHASMRLRGDSGVREAHLRDRQAELRAAVAASVRLQRQAAASADAGRWIREIVKVHVNILLPSDFSFRSSHIIPGLPFAPDNVMRDHRKLVFYDLTEADPYRGAFLIMGVGIGEHYASATWEDRGFRVRGPVAVEARRAAREALMRNGFTEGQIPQPLRAVADGDAVQRQANQGAYVGRAIQVHNQAGFGRKESSVARAMLYNLAPPGSVIIVPDPMWLSDTWAGMLVGAAARGCRVYIIAPAEASAPSPQTPLMALQHEVLTRVLQLRDSLGARIRASNGDLRVGMFAAHANVDDGAGRAREVRDGLARAPWILGVIPFDAKTLNVLQGAERTVAASANGTELARDEKPRAPQLHQKSQLIARPGAISALVRQPGWDAALAGAIRAQAEVTARFAEEFRYANPDVDTTATRQTDALIRGYEQTLSEAERKRVSFYYSVGSQNQDPRGIVSDAETSMIVSGVEASVGVVDLFYLMARSNWVDNEAALSRFNRPRGALMNRLAWLFRFTF